MNVTFGIVTSGKSDELVNEIINGVEAQEIPLSSYEVLVIGPSKVERTNTRVIYEPHSENHPIRSERGWITRKKNLIATHAQMEWLVFLHDYVSIGEGWYSGWVRFLKENSEFELGVNYIYTLEGSRHSDWVLNPLDMWLIFPEFRAQPNNWDVLLPVEENRLNAFQYLSGGFWVASRKFSLEHPQLEELGWGEYEDVRWCKSIRTKHKFLFNPYSHCKLLKPGKWEPKYFPMKYYEQLIQFNGWLDENKAYYI